MWIVQLNINGEVIISNFSASQQVAILRYSKRFSIDSFGEFLSLSEKLAHANQSRFVWFYSWKAVIG